MGVFMESTAVRVTSGAKVRNLVSTAETTLQSEGRVVLSAQGKAIGKCITVVEILKRNLALHQITQLQVAPGTKEGIDEHSLVITLSSQLTDDMKTNPSYQAPYSEEERKQLQTACHTGEARSQKKRARPPTQQEESPRKRGRRGTTFFTA